MASHDTTWLEELYNQHYDQLYRMVCFKLRYYTGSTDSAHDIVQETFVTAANKDIRYHPNQSAWLFKTAGYLCANYVREHWKDRKQSVDIEMTQLQVRSTDTIDPDLLLTFESTLSAQDLWLLREYCLKGTPVEVISRQTGLSVNAIQVRIHRIRKRLKAVLLATCVIFLVQAHCLMFY